MINKIRLQLEENKGRELDFRFNGSRNQIEEFSGVINGAYNKVFTILVDGYGIKSFSYSDILTNVLEILDNTL